MMRNFQKLAENLDVRLLSHAITRQPGLWNQHKVRTSHPRSAHRVVDDIVLRYSMFNEGDDFVDKVCSKIEVVDYPAWHQLPEAHQFIYAMMTQVRGVHLGRVMITRVAPGISIPLHSDRIDVAEEIFPDRIPPAVYYERYHLVLAASPGVQFNCGDESVHMATGEVWWFNNQIPHEKINNSASDNIHLICDIRTQHDHYIPT